MRGLAFHRLEPTPRVGWDQGTQAGSLHSGPGLRPLRGKEVRRPRSAEQTSPPACGRRPSPWPLQAAGPVLKFVLLSLPGRSRPLSSFPRVRPRLPVPGGLEEKGRGERPPRTTCLVLLGKSCASVSSHGEGR